MHIIPSITLGVALAAFSVASHAQTLANGVLKDKNGNPVRSQLTGECARIKWSSGNELCKKAPTPKQQVIRDIERSYLVFFNFNESGLTESANTVLKSLVNEYGTQRIVAINLEGHADKSGSDSYNLALSERRALSVKSALRELGIASNKVSVSWKGESFPLVPTADGIKEPQNRRVEIGVSIR